MLRALGARPLDFVGDEMGPAIDSGQLSGAESEIGLVRGLPRPGIVTANVTFFPKANTIVANRAAFDRLTDDQRETLRNAAAATLGHVVASRETDVEAARSACAVGIRIVVASDADIRGLVRATRPVVARLERDDGTRRSIQRIVALRETVSALPPGDRSVRTPEFPHGEGQGRRQSGHAAPRRRLPKLDLAERVLTGGSRRRLGAKQQRVVHPDAARRPRQLDDKGTT